MSFDELVANIDNQRMLRRRLMRLRNAKWILATTGGAVLGWTAFMVFVKHRFLLFDRLFLLALTALILGGAVILCFRACGEKTMLYNRKVD
jgi:hypothetical protein